MSIKTLIAGYNVDDIDARLAECKAIVDRGNVIRFKYRDIIKHVSKWEMDEDGDVLADWSNGVTLWVCPVAIFYKITEITPEQAAKERGDLN